METIAQEAKRLLEPIPEDKWTTGKYYFQGKCCGIGHFNAIQNSREPSEDSCTWSKKDDLLNETSRKFLKKKGVKDASCLMSVNDNATKDMYQQPTPKQRVLALLDDMIAAGY